MSRPPVILVHGMWSNAGTWGETAQRLKAAGWNSVPYELPEHGARYTGDTALGKQGLRTYGADLGRFIALQPAPPILIGHSMGGLLALKAAETSNVAAVFMIAPAAPAGGFSFSLSNTAVFVRTLTKHLAGVRPFKLSRWESDFGLGNTLSGHERLRLYESLQKESGWPILQIAYSFANPGGAAWMKWDRISAPVRMFLGGRDRIIPAYGPRAMRNKVRDFKLKVEPGAGHFVFLQDDRERFFSWLLGELQALEGSAFRRTEPGSSASSTVIPAQAVIH